MEPAGIFARPPRLHNKVSPFHTQQNTVYFKIKCFKQKQNLRWMSPACIPRFYSHGSKTLLLWMRPMHRTGGKLRCWDGHLSALPLTDMQSPQWEPQCHFLGSRPCWKKLHLHRLRFIYEDSFWQSITEEEHPDLICLYNLQRTMWDHTRISRQLN